MKGSTTSGVGVLDKAALTLGALKAGPATLARLVSATGLARPTAHRLAVTLEYHRMVTRDMQGCFVLDPCLQEFASSAGEDRLLAASMLVPQALRDHTKGSSQLSHRQGGYRMCVAVSEHEMGLHDLIPVGTTLSMTAGSATQVLLAWEEPDHLHRGLYEASFNATMFSQVRRRGQAQSVEEREPGAASVSAPMRSPPGRVLAALSISGSIERMGRRPGRQHGPLVAAVASRLPDFLRSVEDSDPQAPPDSKH